MEIKKDLGITGYPAEMSIYRSLLWNTEIHRETDGVWGFHPPKPDDEKQNRNTHGKQLRIFLKRVKVNDNLSFDSMKI